MFSPLAAAQPLSPGPRLHEGLSLWPRGCEGAGGSPPAAAAQSHGVMEGDILLTCTVLGKFFWEYFHARTFSTFDVCLPGLVSLDY